MKLKKFCIQFAQFFVVGIVNTSVDWVVFFLLTLAPFFVEHRPLAKALSFLVAVVNSFVLNSYWTFKNEYHGKDVVEASRVRRSKIEYFFRFCAVSVLGWAFNTSVYTLVFYFLTGSMPARVADVIGLAFASALVMAWNFLGNKFWTYTHRIVRTETPHERSRRTLFVGCVTLLLVVQVIISVQVMRNDSATVDEVAHIADGYSVVKYQDYRLNPEHPPLVKLLAAAPLTVLDLSDIRQTAGWEQSNQWTAGRAFLYWIGNDADLILLVSRLPIILLLVLLSIVVVRFAKELYGRRVALFVLLFLVCSPELLAHGHLVTTDVAAALGYAAATYYFYHYLQKRSVGSFSIAVLSLAAAQLLKFSAVLLFPIFFLWIVLWSVLQRRQLNAVRLCGRLVLEYVAMCVAALVLVWTVYIPSAWNTPAAVEHETIERYVTADASFTPFVRERLHALADQPVLRGLAHYGLGIYMVFHRVGGGNSTFVLGVFDEKGIVWFFPVAWMLKTPIPVLLLFFGSVCYVLCRPPQTFERRWRICILILPIAVYWVATILGSLNIGIRHLIPILPFVLLLSGELIAPLLRSRSHVVKLIPVALAGWMVVTSAIAYPHYLSYFNEFTIGQPKYELLVDSSLDWGQDLKRLETYVEEHNIEPLRIDYFGGGQPDYYLPESIEWHSANGPVTGYLAVSATFYQFSRLYGQKEGKWSYDWLREIEPVTVIGNSILVYHITEDDLRAHPPTSPYPITQPPSEYVVDPNNFLSQ